MLSVAICSSKGALTRHIEECEKTSPSGITNRLGLTFDGQREKITFKDRAYDVQPQGRIEGGKRENDFQHRERDVTIMLALVPQNLEKGIDKSFHRKRLLPRSIDVYCQMIKKGKHLGENIHLL